MSEVKSYRDLKVWQNGMDFAAEVYRLAKAMPRNEEYRLTSQMLRAAASVPANIAEGHGRENTRSFIQYLRIAPGSLKELETHLLLAERVGILARGQIDAPMGQCEALGKMLRALIRSLQRKEGT